MTWFDVLTGCAYGDALGYPNEFKTYGTLTAQSPRGPRIPEQFVVSDDTQMTLYLAEALHLTRDERPDVIRAAVVEAWITWLHDPDNTRAPGATCLAAIRSLDEGTHWSDATVAESKGCGAVMRVAPAAFLPENRWAGVAAWQAYSTHGHPTAVAASIVAAYVIRHGRHLQRGALTAAALAIARDPWGHLDGGLCEWLVDGLVLEDAEQVRADLDTGFAELATTLRKAQARIRRMKRKPWATDPCSGVGQGWTADTALAVALLCCDVLPDPVQAVRRAAVTGGDSDSIAAIAGAILGSVHENPWPPSWLRRLEPRYRAEIVAGRKYATLQPQGSECAA